MPLSPPISSTFVATIRFFPHSPGDRNGMLEYWSGPRNEYKFPKTAAWDCKTDTDLYEFVKVGQWPILS